MAKAHTLTDNFNDNSTDGSKWGYYGPIQEVNQRLEIRPAGNAGGYGGYNSATGYDLYDSSFHIEVVQPLYDGATNLKAIIDGATNTTMFFNAGGGFLTCQLSGANPFTRRVPYEPESHRWWRLRESSGMLYWDVSADGRNWNILASTPTPSSPNLSSVVIHIQAGNDNNKAAYPGVAIFDSFNVLGTRESRRVEERRLSALATREKAARLAASRLHAEHFNNNDEINYPDRSFIGNFSKNLKHDAVGDPDPIAYGSLLRALESRDPGDFEEILVASTALKLTNPQAGLAFDLEGPDAQAVTQPPAPRFDSKQAAAEMGELYWMAVARDVPFINYASEAGIANSIIDRAIRSLNTEFPQFGGTAPVTAQNLFRGIFPGDQVGPFVSQFLLKGNSDPRKPDGQGRDADEGFITYGAQVIDQRQWTVKGFPDVGASADYLTQFTNWLAVQNGRDDRGKDQFDTTRRRFIRDLRDGANFVHFDQVVNAYWNAAFLLLAEPSGNQLAGMGASRPQIDKEFPCDPGNPYDPPGTTGDSRTQMGFATFGAPHLLQLLIEVSGRAARAVWWQKWGVHRRLRPEEYGGRIDNHQSGRRTYPLDASILTSLSTGLLSAYFPSRWGSFLLPQAYPEGCPNHPAYGAGHATVSGACATLLKAYFEESTPIENPLIASADGTTLVPYTGADAGQMTVGGELNKLASNISLFRNAAGVHWRSDYTESLLLGEHVAIKLLQEMSLTFNEDDAFFQLTRFDGTTIRILQGCVQPVV